MIINHKISVAIAVYNGEKFLKEQLDSIYAQTITPFEIIAIDDCSIDNSVAILQEYSQKFSLKYVQNEKNLGINKTFEKAFLLCSGDFIAPSDQDDIWAKNKLEECYKAILDLPANEPNVVICNSIIMSENKKIISKNDYKNKLYKFEDFFPYINTGGACFLFNSVLKNKAIPFKTALCYDQELAILATLIGNRINIFTTWRFFRVHSKNATGMLMNKGFLGKLRYYIHYSLYNNYLRKKNLDSYIEIIEKYELDINLKKIDFLSKLQNVIINPYKIFFFKEYSFMKKTKVFVIFYICNFFQFLKRII